MHIFERGPGPKENCFGVCEAELERDFSDN